MTVPPARQTSSPPGTARSVRLMESLRGGGRTLVMGVLNVTPDSFSDGGLHRDVDAAVAHGLRLVDDGADLLDVGGESTRPRGSVYGAGAVAVSEDEETERVVPVVRALRAAGCDVALSIDTRKASVARAALQAGADFVNDVSGLLHDPLLANVAANAGVPLVLMHTPADIEALTHESRSVDIVAEVVEGLRRAVDRALAGGVGREFIILDPGLGFGKGPAENLRLLGRLHAVRALGFPVLVGASRKTFLARAVAEGGPLPAPDMRLGASVAAALVAAGGGAAVVRVHDVRETVQALRLVRAVERAALETTWST
jgi:dihydropteroate synthase